MARQNRVTPFGDIIATPDRGTFMGNRGVLHDAEGRIRRAWQVKRWIVCMPEFRGRKRQVMAPGRYTELFFLDEATALAAGHRPCAECRREDYNRLTEFWASVHPNQSGADAIDAQLHSERIDSGTNKRRLFETRFEELPDGAFVLYEDAPHLAVGSALLPWSPAGYVGRRQRPATESATVITPPSLLAL